MYNKSNYKFEFNFLFSKRSEFLSLFFTHMDLNPDQAPNLKFWVISLAIFITLSLYSRIQNKRRAMFISFVGYILIKGAPFFNLFFYFGYVWKKYLLFRWRAILIGVRLLFLQNVPGDTFIQGPTSIPDSRVERFTWINE